MNAPLLGLTHAYEKNPNQQRKKKEHNTYHQNIKYFICSYKAIEINNLFKNIYILLNNIDKIET